MFGRFTPAARAVVVDQAEALGLRHNYIDTEHFVLGLVIRDGTAARLLEEYGIERTRVRQRIIEVIGEGRVANSS